MLPPPSHSELEAELYKPEFDTNNMEELPKPTGFDSVPRYRDLQMNLAQINEGPSNDGGDNDDL